MIIEVTNKELLELRRLGNRLSSYRSDIDKMMDLLDKLEQRQKGVNAPAQKGRRSLKKDRMEKYRSQFR